MTTLQHKHACPKQSGGVRRISVPGAVIEQVMGDFVRVGDVVPGRIHNDKRRIAEILADAAWRRKAVFWHDDDERWGRGINVGAHLYGAGDDFQEVCIGRGGSWLSEFQSTLTLGVVGPTEPMVVVGSVITATAASVGQKYQQEKQPSQGCGG